MATATGVQREVSLLSGKRSTKAVIQAIPIDAMSCLKFPTGLCDDIFVPWRIGFGGSNARVNAKFIGLTRRI